MDLEGLLGSGFEVSERRGHVEGEGGGAGFFEVGELGWVAGGGDDGVAATKGLAGEGGAEARGAAGDEPDFWRHDSGLDY